jgi:Fibronectin type III-like domain
VLHFNIPYSTLGYWDVVGRSWRIEPGAHRILAGGSSRADDLIGVDVRL